MDIKMIKKVYRLNGVVINIGEWDYMLVKLEDGFTKVNNPLPEGATCSNEEVVLSDMGVFVKSDYQAIRKSEYPSITDQLDALWKGGDAMELMRATIVQIKCNNPKNTYYESTQRNTMSKQIRLRRGTTAEQAAFTGAEAELTYDEELRALVLHDGVTSGGNYITPILADTVTGDKYRLIITDGVLGTTPT